MNQQQSFSHGLLYSIAPENFSELHIGDEIEHDAFDWSEQQREAGFAAILKTFLAITAAKWGLLKSSH